MRQFPTIHRALLACAVGALVLAAGCHSMPFAWHKDAPAPVVAANTPLGTSLDDIDARNRADIAAQLGRPVAPGPATVQEVAAMARAGIASRYIVCYINRSVDMRPITAQDVIYLHDAGVDEQVIQAMLTPGAANTRCEVARSMPPRVIIVEDPWWPYYYPRYGFAYGYGYGCRCY